MPISKSEFKEIFREVISSEFLHIPKNEDEIDFEFSERFNKRMTKLINSQKKAYYKLINTAAKRVAIIFVLILTMFTAAFSVKAIREPIIKFVKQIYETFIHYSVEGETVDKITEEYSLTYVPEGFNKTNVLRDDNFVITTYENATDEIIMFSQMTTSSYSGHLVDNETGNVYSESIDGIKVELKEWNDNKIAIWIEHGYVFTLDCHGNISFDTIKEIICSIQ